MIKFIFITLLACSITALGQTNKGDKHPIDIKCEACHEVSENQTTMGMIDCEIEAQEAWDKELNKNYKDLMAVLSKEEKDKLRASQLKWIAYRDAELDFSGTTYYNLQGSMWRVVAAGRRTEITRARTLELKSYIDSLTEY